MHAHTGGWWQPSAEKGDEHRVTAQWTIRSDAPNCMHDPLRDGVAETRRVHNTTLHGRRHVDLMQE